MKNTKSQIDNRINLRAALIDAIITKAELSYGGKGNATVSQPHFRPAAGLRANYLVHGLNPYK